MTSSEFLYLDYAAATPLDERVAEAMQPYLREHFFNPSSPYQPAIAVRREYEAAKEAIARVIGASAQELVMTAGATESINQAFLGTSGHTIVSAIEHPAVLEAAKRRPHTVVGVDRHGRISPSELAKAIRDDTELISIGLANNEIGTIQPLSEIAGLVADVRTMRLEAGNAAPLLLHSDASQAPALLDVNVGRLGVDLLTLNAAKVYGPKQVGLLYVSRRVKLRPLIVGGGQENGLRSGTENVAGTVGFSVALQTAEAARKREARRQKILRDTLEQRLTDAFKDKAVISGHPKHRLANYAHVSFVGIDAERLVFMLEARGVLVATGSACAANKHTRSHVLEAIDLSDELADGSLRLTLGRDTDEETIHRAADIIIDCVRQEQARLAA